MNKFLFNLRYKLWILKSEKFVKMIYDKIFSLINIELGYSDIDFNGLSKRLDLMKTQGKYHIFCAFSDNNLVGFLGAIQEIAFQGENF